MPAPLFFGYLRALRTLQKAEEDSMKQARLKAQRKEATERILQSRG